MKHYNGYRRIRGAAGLVVTMMLIAELGLSGQAWGSLATSALIVPTRTASSPSAPVHAVPTSRAFAPAVPTSRASAPVAVGAAPQLSISLDNGRTSAAPGDSLSYVLTLTNLGAADVDGLRITQSVPTGLALVKADAGGKERNGVVGWSVNLRAAKVVTFHVTLKVSATPKDLLRLASVACASLPAKTSPIVCASHSDQLPAGAAAASSTAAHAGVLTSDRNVASSPAPGRGRLKLWFFATAAALILGLAAIALVVTRRGRAARIRRLE